MSRLMSLKGMKSAYEQSLRNVKQSLNQLQSTYDVINERLELVEKAIADEEKVVA